MEDLTNSEAQETRNDTSPDPEKAKSSNKKVLGLHFYFLLAEMSFWHFNRRYFGSDQNPRGVGTWQILSTKIGYGIYFSFDSVDSIVEQVHLHRISIKKKIRYQVMR